METEQRKLCKTLEAEMIGASGLMEAEELLDCKGPEYFRGFIQGYLHCLLLADKLDELSHKEDPI